VTQPPDVAEIIAAIEAKNYEAALSLLSPLVDAGIPSAVGLLGTFYQLGLGVPPNGEKAVSLLTQAAEAGDALAAHNLGTVYCTGLPGVDRNPDLGRSWYAKARGLGSQLLPPDAYE
jgi:TPR repeat protein